MLRQIVIVCSIFFTFYGQPDSEGDGSLVRQRFYFIFVVVVIKNPRSYFHFICYFRFVREDGSISLVKTQIFQIATELIRESIESRKNVWP